LITPPRIRVAGRPGQHFALVRDCGQDLVERRLPVCRDQEAPAARQLVGVPHLVAVEARQFTEFRVRQAVLDELRAVGLSRHELDIFVDGPLSLKNRHEVAPPNA
jgi:hypothetical protein